MCQLLLEINMKNCSFPSQILHPEGVVDVSNLSQPVVHYHLKDHLGNVRAVVNPSATNTALISQTNDYYPFGMCYTKMPGPFVNKRKYNGKEEQEMPGRWLDYGASWIRARARSASNWPISSRSG